MINTPPKPTTTVIKEYLCKWERLESYQLQESSLNLIFKSFPLNAEIEHVLPKACILNAFYSTNIFDITTVAKHILKKNFDERLLKDDYSLVNDIALVEMNGKTKNFYSFASKYCSHHKKSEYPIYDSFVKQMLMYYKKVNKFEKFKADDLKEYKQFVTIVKKFKEFYNLESATLRDIDIFLWVAGKECFPKKY